ncbi:MAG: TPMT family class I SAM-dependent methyltransferase [Sandaracinaceae bacterium]|nr:TPMT family class I SAM-dependent methyltransferase [Sandaracinaceae bacterium]
MSWEDAWREGRTGWDAGGSPPALIELGARGVLPAGRALVPGCGAGWDVLTLAEGRASSSASTWRRPRPRASPRCARPAASPRSAPASSSPTSSTTLPRSRSI